MTSIYIFFSFFPPFQTSFAESISRLCDFYKVYSAHQSRKKSRYDNISALLSLLTIKLSAQFTKCTVKSDKIGWFYDQLTYFAIVILSLATPSISLYLFIFNFTCKTTHSLSLILLSPTLSFSYLLLLVSFLLSTKVPKNTHSHSKIPHK